jgi:hypothetical protein
MEGKTMQPLLEDQFNAPKIGASKNLKRAFHQIQTALHESVQKTLRRLGFVKSYGFGVTPIFPAGGMRIWTRSSQHGQTTDIDRRVIYHSSWPIIK